MFSQVSGSDGRAKSLSKKRTKVAEEVMSNDDLLLEVLLLLPAKPLTRFKCVSKRWLSLISDPKFGSKHTRLNPLSLTLGIYFDDKYNSGLQSVSFDEAHQKNLPSLAFIKRASPSFYSDRPKIMHACNGLILCSYGWKSPYFVCNMTTQKTTILPQHVLPSSSEWYSYDYCAYLVTDPSTSPHFKVVLLDTTFCKHDTTLHYDDQYEVKTAHCYGLCYEIDVYSSETGVWKRLYFRALHGYPLYYKAVCDGSLHWITKNKFHARFEVDTLKLVSNPMPSEPTMDMERIRYFGECGGHLFLIHIPQRSVKPFHVFELEKDHSSWKMKYCVNLSRLMAAYPDSFQYLEPTKQRLIPTFIWKNFVLCVVKEDEINGFSVMLVIPGRIVSYNLKKKTFKVLQELPMKQYPLFDRYCWADTFPFMATLSPPV